MFYLHLSRFCLRIFFKKAEKKTGKRVKKKFNCLKGKKETNKTAVELTELKFCIRIQITIKYKVQNCTKVSEFTASKQQQNQNKIVNL